MDLVGSMIVEHLNRLHGDEVEATAIVPPFREAGWAARGSAGTPTGCSTGTSTTPGSPVAWRRRGEFDLFHVVDHSYAQLVESCRQAGRS